MSDEELDNFYNPFAMAQPTDRSEAKESQTEVNFAASAGTAEQYPENIEEDED